MRFKAYVQMPLIFLTIKMLHLLLEFLNDQCVDNHHIRFHIIYLFDFKFPFFYSKFNSASAFFDLILNNVGPYFIFEFN